MVDLDINFNVVCWLFCPGDFVINFLTSSSFILNEPTINLCQLASFTEDDKFSEDAIVYMKDHKFTV